MSPTSTPAVAPSHPLPRLGSASPAAVRELVEAAVPVVFTPAAPDRLLAVDDLFALLSGQQVVVSVSGPAGFRAGDGVTRVPARRMLFDDVAAAVATERAATDGDLLYLSQHPLPTPQVLPRLDPVIRPFLPADLDAIDMHLWFGPARTVSPFHFDRSHNLLRQHAGRKHVLVVDPTHSDAMAARPKDSGSPHVSTLDIVTPHHALDLAALRCPVAEVTLEPGEVLFLPAYWWHHVVALDRAISTNYWWRAPLAACLYPNFARMLSSPVVYREPEVVHRWADLGEHGLSTALCVALAAGGQPFAAAALAGALVTAFCSAAMQALGVQAQGPADAREPDVDGAAAVVAALTDRAVLDSEQAAVLRECLVLARETAATEEVSDCSRDWAVAARITVERLHARAGSWLTP